MVRINPDDYDAAADEMDIDEPENQVRGRSIDAIAAIKLAKNILTYLGLGFQGDKRKKLVYFWIILTNHCNKIQGQLLGRRD